MYASSVGRRILDLYNEDQDTELMPRAFFDEVVFPVAFDDKRYMFWPNNSPFAQPSYSGKRDDPAVRQAALKATHEKISEIEAPVGHLFMGGMATSVNDTTSGQVSTVGASATQEEAYCSWVGALAGIGVAGGVSWLIPQDDVLRAVVEGWKQYRIYLNQTPGLKGNQIETWNGQWIAHRFGYDFHSDDPLRDFDASKTSKKLKTMPWARVLFPLAREFPEQRLTAYIYSLGQTNETIGFRQIHLPDVRRLMQLYEHLFGDVEGVSARELATLYETEHSIYRACEQGVISLKALQPSKLKTYMPGRNESKMPKSTRSANKQFRYRTFQTWIVAMLNNEELISLTEETAQALREHAASGTKGRTTPKRRAEQVLDAGHRREFLDAITAVLEEDGSHADHFNKVADQVVKMPASDFPLFATLLRLKYTVFSK